MTATPDQPTLFSLGAIEDYEDSHGKAKEVLQHVLCPHELVATFLENGELNRMIGSNDSWSNVFC